MNRTIYVVLVVAAALAVAGFRLSASGQNMQANGRQVHAQPPANMLVAKAKPEAITRADEYPDASVQGPSWLKHLGLTVSKTQMGKVGTRVFDPATPDKKPEAATGSPARTDNLKPIVQRFLSTFRAGPEQSSEILNEKFVVAGADLYRWNCQGCHGPDGKGSEPEINSVQGPVQGTSAALAKARMEARGIEADDDMINQMTELAAASLRDRLQHGGKSMPSFEYLRTDEVEALLGHLEKLSGVPPTKRDGLLVPESAVRVAEHIERGTCHICHDAAGPGAGQASLKQGTIPSLISLPRDHSLSGVVHQVQYGSCDMMKMTGGDVMPAYPYFTEEEIAAVYFAKSAARK
ncbi:MAG: cytochrome c [Acidobacteriia bacterium]|nr:cytochrome c [Terriglobia bacterium]